MNTHMEHLFFEDTAEYVIAEDIRGQINDIYNTMLANRDYDYHQDGLFHDYPQLINAKETLLELRRVFQSEVADKIIRLATQLYQNDRQLDKGSMMIRIGFANNLKDQAELAKITLEKFNSILDDHYDDELPIETISKSILGTF